ncbi:MAG: hypothetical protein K8R25_12735 [Methanosarcinales archaeon]|nr:hypothetical protein [Methanosarcinales archaeon]
MGSRIGLTNSSAQINIDFLAGISIFLISFLLVVQLVPNLFIPFQGQPVTLHSVGYRTSVILCEDPGWYNLSNATVNISGYNWEDYPNNVSRLGLAKNKSTENLSTPQMLSGSKLFNLTGIYNSSDPGSYSNIQEHLGLTTSYRKYDYNISLVRFDGIPSSYMNGTPFFQIGYSPQSNIDVEKVERIVSFEMYDLPHDYNKTNFSRLNPAIDVVNLPISAYRICIESVNFSGSPSNISINLTNHSGTTYQLMNTTTYLPTDMPVILDLSDELNKYDDLSHKVTITIDYSNIIWYCYSSHAGDLVGDKLAAKLIIQVW